MGKIFRPLVTRSDSSKTLALYKSCNYLLTYLLTYVLMRITECFRFSLHCSILKPHRFKGDW